VEKGKTGSSNKPKDKMSTDRDRQKKAFEFLLEKFHSQELFTKEDLQKATGWSSGTWRTYYSKQLKDLLMPVDSAFRVHGAFAKYANWTKFRDDVVTQNRRLVNNYEPLSFKSVVIFEFFMPLRNEEYLRTSLDALFFKDSIAARLRMMDETKMHQQFPPKEEEKKEAYFERLCTWISAKFVGYSILHVNGRFRVGGLKTHEEVAKAQDRSAQRYLVDETTAVVRFIIPCGFGAPSQFDSRKGNSKQLELASGTIGLGAESQEEELLTEAARIRWFFAQLFVQRIIEVVAGEDEIWLLESGMQSQLHIWRGRE
jgi:hypothetical protein